jgi:hypothetical protein
MRIVIVSGLIGLAGLAGCSREPASAVDVSAVAAERAEANIDNYAAGNAAVAHPAAHAAVPRQRAAPRLGSP